MVTAPQLRYSAAEPVHGAVEAVRGLAKAAARRANLGWLLCAVLAVAGCSAAPAAVSPPITGPGTVATTSAAQSGTGAYLDFATCDPVTLHQRTGTTQVYFFTQPDCAGCAATDAALLANGVPDGFTVFKVDLPSMAELADRYGVTAADTFVQVDADGRKVHSWTGSRDGADIAARAR